MSFDINEVMTEEAVRASLAKAVAERGADFVYEPKGKDSRFEDSIDTCLYQHEGKPDCIVGYVLDDLGVPYDPKWEGDNADTVLYREGLESQAIRESLWSVQSYQDWGEPWGEAVKAFDGGVQK